MRSHTRAHTYDSESEDDMWTFECIPRYRPCWENLWTHDASLMRFMYVFNTIQQNGVTYG